MNREDTDMRDDDMANRDTDDNLMGDDELRREEEGYAEDID